MGSLKNDSVVTPALLQSETGRTIEMLWERFAFFVHKVRMKVVTWWES